MAENTAISWAHHTLNPWIGCAKVSAGCDMCYAETLSIRRGWHDWDNQTPRKTMADSTWKQPARWNRKAEAAGERHRVFCASLADVFDPHGPAPERERMWEAIRQTPHLDWLLLTKRPQNIARFLPADWGPGGYPNVWLGITAEDQENYDRRWPVLSQIPARVRFISYEPALGPLSLLAGGIDAVGRTRPDWVICGGESGPGHRPPDGQWFGDMRDQCRGLRIPFWFKQWGGNRPGGEARLGGFEYQEVPM